MQNDRTAENPMCSAFPTLTACKFKSGGINGLVDLETSLCVLSQNIINQKIYLFLWFWMILLMVAAGICTIYRVAQIILPKLRKETIVALINTKRRRSEFVDKDNAIRRNWSELNRIGNWFLLCQIGRNSNPYYFRKFLESVNENDRRTRQDNYSDAGIEKRNSDVEEGVVKVPLV